MVDVEVIGTDRLAATLAGAAGDLTRLTGAAQNAARLLVSRGQANAPKVSGQLSRSIHAMETRGSEVVVGSTLIYAPVIHNGWRAHNIRPNPYLTRALDESTEQVTDLYVRDIEGVLQQVKGA